MTELSDAERQMLEFALREAQEMLWSCEGFTEEDQAALDSLKTRFLGDPDGS